MSRREILNQYSLGELVPEAVVYPKSSPQVSAALQVANAHRAPVLLWGSGASIRLGSRLSGLHIVVDMTSLDRVLSHDIDNFTVTVQAGMRLGQLQEVLREHRQFLPLDPSAAERVTLGGIAAANVSGPWRLLFGSPRDLVLGMKVALADGSIVSFGGSTMKNVAGYDIGKLFIGSLGTLGAICELTLRLYSLPEESRSLLLHVSGTKRAFGIARKILACSPAAVQALDASAAKQVNDKIDLRSEEESWLVAVDLMGDSAAVEKQAQEIEKSCGREIVSLVGEERLQTWKLIRNLIGAEDESIILCRANLPPACIEEWAGIVREVSPDCLLVACPGTGRAWMRWRPQTQDAASEAIGVLRAEAVKLGGHLIVEAAPEEWRSGLDIWGQPPAELPLLRAVKQAFDPAGILAPGRFVGGI
ncbi:MAG: FAD-binding protein [Armatimonadetes bacterium]|nr:FAD-binding protein [Armatimonadota bacterium]NIM23923.1 FAD-binding protein [Armatimonadota bacterium]NIM67770.1 FAD-binding protein [Armatimonadota bacterium]NIN06004.1 FAD-binding protein [Armatimonadota bacterium]NIO97390.1 FAD-binding protein [Armatimonadota bacterium]